MNALKVSVLIGCVCVVSSQVTSRDVVLEQGPVRGYNDDREDIFSFYGIPFATAPSGDDKFKGPLPPPTWTEIFNATNRDVLCPQGPLDAGDLGEEFTLDCLVINVFVPTVANATTLPVYIYVHGGAFQYGSSVEFLPLNLAATGIITVTFNYRLGPYGFLCLGTEFAPGNAGYKDQSAAFRWVQNNIAQFGGDPNNVMIAGSSAGGLSVELQIVSPLSNGLFQKAALECGSAFSTEAVFDLDPIFVAQTYARTFGVEIGRDVQALEDFYRSLTDDQVNGGGGIPVDAEYDFKTCIETHNIEGVDKFIDALPIDIIRSGNYEPRTLLTGFTSMDGLAFINLFDERLPVIEEDISQLFPRDLFVMYESESARLEAGQRVKEFYFPDGEITYEAYTDFVTDSLFAYPHWLSARLHTQNSATVFLYMWSFNGTVNLPPVYSSPIWGPGHVAQTLYLLEYFNDMIYANMTPEDYILQDRIWAIYRNFAFYGEPIPTQTQLLDAEWLPLTNETDHFLDIDLVLTPGQIGTYPGPLRERMEFWEEIYVQAATGSASKNFVFTSFLFIGAFFTWLLN